MQPKTASIQGCYIPFMGTLTFPAPPPSPLRLHPSWPSAHRLGRQTPPSNRPSPHPHPRPPPQNRPHSNRRQPKPEQFRTTISWAETPCNEDSGSRVRGQRLRVKVLGATAMDTNEMGFLYLKQNHGQAMQKGRDYCFESRYTWALERGLGPK